MSLRVYRMSLAMDSMHEKQLYQSVGRPIDCDALRYSGRIQHRKPDIDFALFDCLESSASASIVNLQQTRQPMMV